MALFQRERSGLGQSIEVPMFENMAVQVLTEHLYNRSFVPPLGKAGDPRLLNAFYAPSKTADGYISITANTDAQVFALMAEMGQAEFRHDPRFNSVAARGPTGGPRRGSANTPGRSCARRASAPPRWTRCWAAAPRVRRRRCER